MEIDVQKGKLRSKENGRTSLMRNCVKVNPIFRHRKRINLNYAHKLVLTAEIREEALIVSLFA